MKRSCIDGPVFNGAKVAWDESRYRSGPAVLDEEPEEPEPVERLTDAELWGDA
jgi:dihydroorotate dehydrogenase electron transfer subunit